MGSQVYRRQAAAREKAAFIAGAMWGARNLFTPDSLDIEADGRYLAMPPKRMAGHRSIEITPAGYAALAVKTPARRKGRAA